MAEAEDFLRSSAAAFDAGKEAEAKRLAVVLRVLLHHTTSSHSLLEQLGMQDQLSYADTAEPINPNNLAPSLGSIMMEMSMNGGRYVPHLGDGPIKPTTSQFAPWWRNAVMKVQATTWSREQMVKELPNREGGAHVDPSLNEQYETIARKNGVGFTFCDNSGGGPHPFGGNPIAIGVRQVSYELLQTLEAHRHLTH